jgi:hypothetical protein
MIEELNKIEEIIEEKEETMKIEEITETMKIEETTETQIIETIEEEMREKIEIIEDPREIKLTAIEGHLDKKLHIEKVINKRLIRLHIEEDNKNQEEQQN